MSEFCCLTVLLYRLITIFVVDFSRAILNRVRPLAHAGFKSAQHPTEVVPGLVAPKKSTGIVNKAMDLFFGW